MYVIHRSLGDFLPGAEVVESGDALPGQQLVVLLLTPHITQKCTQDTNDMHHRGARNRDQGFCHSTTARLRGTHIYQPTHFEGDFSYTRSFLYTNVWLCNQLYT